MADASVQSSVGRELARRKLSPANTYLAAVALAMAEVVDDASQSGSARAAAEVRLEAVMTALGITPKAAEPVKGDAVDDLARRRASRKAARSSAAADQ